MSVETSKQVLNQVLDPLRASAVMPHDAATLAFQLLTWADQSKKGAFGSELRIDQALQSGASGIVEGLERLAQSDGLVGQAFNNASVVARSAFSQVVEAATAAKRLVDGGVLERFHPSSVAADLQPWVLGFEPIGDQLADLLLELTLSNIAKSVYCPWEFSGQLIGATSGDDFRVHAECVLPFPLPALVALSRPAETVVSITDPIRSPTAVKAGHLEKFDVTVAFPPIGTKVDSDATARDIYDRFSVPKATGTGLMIQHIISQTFGMAAVVVPNSFLFGPGGDREVREHLLRRRQVQAVIALPPGILANTNIRVAILLFNTRYRSDSVRFVDATQDYFRTSLPKGRASLKNAQDIVTFCVYPDEMRGDDFDSVFERLGSSLAASVPAEFVLENEGSLQVDRYVMPPERRRLQSLLEAAPSVALGSLVEFVSPLPHKDRDTNGKGTRVLEVGAADLPPVGYIQTPAKEIFIQPSAKTRSGSASEIYLRPYDVVLIIKGSVGKLGVVPSNVPPPGEGGWIAGQSATVLRSTDERTDLRSLALMLRSQIGQELLATIQSGATIQMISLSALRRLAVPVFPAALARQAVEVLESESELQRQIDDLQSKQASLNQTLWDNLLTSSTHD